MFSFKGVNAKKMECFDCKFHEIFSDDIDGESFGDGCICYNEKAELEDRHIKCCWEYGGKEKCPYKEMDIEQIKVKFQW